MKSVKVNGIELEYELVGSGEPVLLISPVLADGFLPLLSEPTLADRYQLIRYHKRGWAGSTHTPPPVSVADHAADAAALLEGLGLRRAHIAGHSSGAAVGVQLALDHPETVHTLTLLELLLFSVPSGEAFLQQAGPAFVAYENGDHAGALALFMAAVTGLDWATCQALLAERAPGAVAQAIEGCRHLLRRRAAGSDRLGVRRRAGSRTRQARAVHARQARRNLCGWRLPSSSAPLCPASTNARSTAWVTYCTSNVPSPSPVGWRSSWDATPWAATDSSRWSVGQLFGHESAAIYALPAG